MKKIILCACIALAVPSFSSASGLHQALTTQVVVNNTTPEQRSQYLNAWREQQLAQVDRKAYNLPIHIPFFVRQDMIKKQIESQYQRLKTNLQLNN
ncbi:MAG: hypothetical protein ACPHV3_06005 [Vibrio sp.]